MRERIINQHINTFRAIAKPLHTLKRLFKGDFAAFSRSTAAIKTKAKKAGQFVVSAALAFLFKNPSLRNRLQRMLMRLPWLRQRLLRVAVNAGIVGNSPLPASIRGYQTSPPELEAMTPRARQIYEELKSAVKKTGRV